MSIFDTLTALANAIRSKAAITGTLTLEQMTQSLENMTVTDTLILSDPEMGLYLESNGKGLQFAAYPAEGTGRMIVDDDTKIITKVAAGELGDATAADVRAGKTFTSAAGLKVTGTMEV